MVAIVQVINVDNMWCLLHPPYATLGVHLPDKGIVSVVKARYRLRSLKWLLRMDHCATQRHNFNFQPNAQISNEDNPVPTVTPDTPLKLLKLSVRRGIRHVSGIWSSCEHIHIRNY